MTGTQKSSPLTFDSAKISIGGYCIARGTSLKTFTFILHAIGVHAEPAGEDTVCIDGVTLFYNLHGKCYIRFADSEGGMKLFSGLRLVIDPDLYPGLRGIPRNKRMALLRDFVTVSLADRLRAAKADETARTGASEFHETAANTFESDRIRIRHEQDPYHAIIALSYLAGAPAESGLKSVPEQNAAEWEKRFAALEKRLEKVENENRELRKVNDMVLELFSGLKPAHDLQTVTIQDEHAPEVDRLTARKNALIERYFKI